MAASLKIADISEAMMAHGYLKSPESVINPAKSTAPLPQASTTGGSVLRSLTQSLRLRLRVFKAVVRNFSAPSL